MNAPTNFKNAKPLPAPRHLTLDQADASFADRVQRYTDSGMRLDKATALVLIEAPLSVIPGGAAATLGNHTSGVWL